VPPTVLTPHDARRALYIDFEGRKDAPPVLLGCTRRSRVRGDLSVWQATTEPSFRALADGDGKDEAQRVGSSRLSLTTPG
jgi:hypothetical protein